VETVHTQLCLAQMFFRFQLYPPGRLLCPKFKHLHLRKKLAVVAPSFTADCVETLEVDLAKVVELTVALIFWGMLDQLSFK